MKINNLGNLLSTVAIFQNACALPVVEDSVGLPDLSQKGRDILTVLTGIEEDGSEDGSDSVEKNPIELLEKSVQPNNKNVQETHKNDLINKDFTEPEINTGFEGLDYEDLESALAQEMFNLNALATNALHINDPKTLDSLELDFDFSQNQSSQKAKSLESENDDEKRSVRSTSLESRLLRNRYGKAKAGGNNMPRWMRLAVEMKRRNRFRRNAQ